MHWRRRAVPLHAQKPEATERISKSFKVGPSGTLDISNVSGKVIVSAGGTDTIVVDAVKRLRGSAADAKDQFAQHRRSRWSRAQAAST